MDSAEDMLANLDLDELASEFSDMGKTPETESDPGVLSQLDTQKVDEKKPDIQVIKPAVAVDKQTEPEKAETKTVVDPPKASTVFPLEYITPKDFDTVVYPELKKEFKDIFSSEHFKQAVQKAATKGEKGYDTTGLSSQYLIDRMNDIVGRTHWNIDILNVDVKLGSSGKAFVGVASIQLVIGNTVSGEGEGWDFVPIWRDKPTAGSSINKMEGDAIKGCVTNAFKKACADIGLGAEAYRGTLDDDLEEIDKNLREDAKTKDQSQGSGTTNVIPLPISQGQAQTNVIPLPMPQVQTQILEQARPWVASDPLDEQNRGKLIGTIQKIYHALGYNSESYLAWLNKPENRHRFNLPSDVQKEDQITYGAAQSIYKLLMDAYNQAKAKGGK